MPHSSVPASALDVATLIEEVASAGSRSLAERWTVEALIKLGAIGASITEGHAVVVSAGVGGEPGAEEHPVGGSSAGGPESPAKPPRVLRISPSRPELNTYARAFAAVLRAGVVGGGTGAEAVAADRVDALTLITSSLAHEFNNPLAAVLANLEIATRQVSEQLKQRATYSWLDDLHGELDDARLAADRIHQMLRQLKVLGASTGRDSTDVAQAIDCVVQLTGRALRQRGRFHRADQERLIVVGGGHAVTHALLAMVGHALQVVPAQRSTEANLLLATRRDEQVSIRLSYDGPAFARPSAPPAFAVASALAAQAGGTFTFVDAGEGSLTWTLTFDAAKRTPTPTPLRQSAATARILVIDDEPLIGKAVTRMLADHDVHVATNPDDGRSRAIAETWDMILVDMNIPPSSGEAIYQALRASSRELAAKVVFATGGATHPAQRAFLESVDNPRVQKPFDQALLRRLAKESVDASGSGR